MLEQLRIENLGVIESISLLLPSGSIAVTGETGAGKTMVVSAIQLLLGARAEPEMIRRGTDQAIVEGRFIDRDGTEVVVKRVLPAGGRSRAYIDGSLATAAELQQRIGPLVDLHGQHAQQSLLRPATQRDALDAFAGVDTGPLALVRANISAIDAELDELGGDETERARRIDLLSYQLDELGAANLGEPDEDVTLLARESILANALEHQTAAGQAGELVSADGPIAEALGNAASLLDDDGPFTDSVAKIISLQEQLAELSADLRSIGEEITDDPEEREHVRQRLSLLVELKRKYGPSLTDVIAYTEDLQRQLAELQSHEVRVGHLIDQRNAAMLDSDRISAEIERQRREAAPKLAESIEGELAALSMPNAKIEIEVAGPAGDNVSILLAPNPGLPLLPVGKGASGGELSRTMLALRLVLAGGPPIQVFDEVDAGIGGGTARAVGQALSSLGADGQVFVVTHLAQVASYAGSHIVIDKSNTGTSTTSQARVLTDEQRVVEVSRMLSGSPDSTVANEHAEELLAATSSTWETTASRCATTQPKIAAISATNAADSRRAS